MIDIRQFGRCTICGRGSCVIDFKKRCSNCREAKV